MNPDNIPMIESIEFETLYNVNTNQRLAILTLNGHPFKITYELAKKYMEDNVFPNLKEEFENFIKKCEN